MHARILIVDAAATNRVIHKVKFARAFYTPMLASDGASCLRMAHDERPDLILLDLALPDMAGGDVLSALRADPATRSIPIIALASRADPSARLAALRDGADDVMSRPESDLVLLARVRNLLRSRAEEGIVAQAWGEQAPNLLGLAEPPAAFEPSGCIGLVTSRPESAIALKHVLNRRMRDRLVVLPPDQAMALPPERGSDIPDVFLIDADLDGGGGGMRLMSALKSHAGTRQSAFCIIAAQDDGHAAEMAFDLGADDVIAATAPEAELELRLRTLLRRKRQTDRTRATLEDGLRLAMFDPLTGIYNRRYALPRLAGIAAQAAAEGTTFAVMVVDLDRFKRVNDRYGHSSGDVVLVEVARRLADNLRVADMIARIGGEEFLVALPQTDLANAERVAERLRQVVGDDPIVLPGGDALSVTVSIGVAVGGPSSGPGGLPTDENGTQAIERADRALLRSKSGGRNLVTFNLSAA